MPHLSPHANGERHPKVTLTVAAIITSRLGQGCSEAYDTTEMNGQSASMVQAAMGIAKLHGMLVDKVEQTTKAADNMTPDELAAELSRVQAELDAIESPAELGAQDKPTEH